MKLTLTRINLHSKLVDIGTSAVLPMNICDRFRRDGDGIEDFFSLYAGDDYKDRSHPKDNSCIDSFWVDSICSLNSFNVDPSQDGIRVVTDESTSTKTDDLLSSQGSAIYLTATRINHACDGNCIRVFVGDMMVIRAFRNIKKGQEILFSYVDQFKSLERRQEKLKKHCFVCTCRLCKLDRDEPKEQRDLRQEMKKRFDKSEIRGVLHRPPYKNPNQIKKELSTFISCINQCYEQSNRKELRTDLFFISTAQSHALKVMKETRKAVECHQEQLLSLGCTLDGDLDDALCCSLFVNIFMQLYITTSDQKWLKKSKEAYGACSIGGQETFEECFKKVLMYKALG
ncbi:hypothetical protein AKO1_012920 [Acrasis kona]|uniref:SET domain-containing protein n=1 Tax=Acrasis kona TaxID=1008807 RepID=A0AAW2YXV3_9EUKA